ncbi:hypothetical protein NQT62_14120 [Limnobacter humi]|uniref:Uncharacterized protein n=1 Tax=Limnobacter humi TaxID=1778671 RepID=A0ABT1WJ96_9BURK|nr:hypothetical protein [Limnobacter humi]MCQ8897574.1 hypothetical protein [Limnobacter humi]
MKLDLKTDASMLLNEVSRLLGLAPLMVMMAAVLMVVVTALAVKDFIKSEQTEKKNAELPQFKLLTEPVPASLYAEYAAVLQRLSPAVVVEASKDSLEISIAKEANFPEFMFVLNSIQGVSKKVIWKADDICLASCKGKASYAVVKGITEKVQVKLRGQGNE